MSRHFNDYLGNDPLVYIREAMSRFNPKGPPIDAKEFADSIGLKVIEYDTPPASYGVSHKTLVTQSARLVPAENRIYVYKRMSPVRIRLGITHESTHSLKLDHVESPDFAAGGPCTEDASSPLCKKRIEQEAFHGGAAILLYLRWFMPDLMSFNSIGIKSIEQLANRYVVSREATAIWFAHVHPGLCAIVVAEEQKPQVAATNGYDGGAVLPMDWERRPAKLAGPIWTPPSGRFRGDGVRFPLQVKYSESSSRLKAWIPAGRLIPETSLIYKAFTADQSVHGEVPASDFGSSSKAVFNAECLPFDADGSRNVMVLLWLPDRQFDLAISNPYAGW